MGFIPFLLPDVATASPKFSPSLRLRTIFFEWIISICLEQDFLKCSPLYLLNMYIPYPLCILSISRRSFLWRSFKGTIPHSPLRLLFLFLPNFRCSYIGNLTGRQHEKYSKCHVWTLYWPGFIRLQIGTTAWSCACSIRATSFIHKLKCVRKYAKTVLRPCGAMDNASDYGSEDSRFESWQGHLFKPCSNFFWKIQWAPVWWKRIDMLD